MKLTTLDWILIAVAAVLLIVLIIVAVFLGKYRKAWKDKTGSYDLPKAESKS